MSELILALLPIIALLETGSGVRDNGHAIGVYQITPIFVQDVNRIGKTSYNHEDARVERTAQQMIYTYLNYYGRKFAERHGRRPSAYDLAMIFRKGPFGYTKLEHNYGQRAVNLYESNRRSGK